MISKLRELSKSRKAWLALLAAAHIAAILAVPADFSHSGGNFELVRKYANSLVSEGSLTVDHVAPGQPVLLAFASAALPVSDITVRFVQAGLILVLIVMTYMAAEVYFGRRVALVSAIVIALWPPVMLQIFSQSADLMFSAIFASSLYLVFKSWRLESYTYAMAAGIALALGALTDPIGLYLPLIFVCPMLFDGFRAWSRDHALARKHVFGAGLIIMTFVISLTPWYYRNVSVFGLEDAPIIQKGWETMFIEDSEVRRYVSLTFSPAHSGVVIRGLSEFFLVPFGVDALDQDTGLSYKSVLSNFLKGEMVLSTLSSTEMVVLVLKTLISLLHWLLLVSVLAGVWLPRCTRVSFLYLATLAYLIIATFSYGVWERFENISPLNGFFFLIIPLTMIIGVKGFLHLFKIREK